MSQPDPQPRTIFVRRQAKPLPISVVFPDGRHLYFANAQRCSEALGVTAPVIIRMASGVVGSRGYRNKLKDCKIEFTTLPLPFVPPVVPPAADYSGYDITHTGTVTTLTPKCVASRNKQNNQ